MMIRLAHERDDPIADIGLLREVARPRLLERDLDARNGTDY
jgi:hypothetical protein